MSYTVTLVPGDGIGPEVTGAVLAILDASGVAIDWDRQTAGAEAFERTGTALPAELLDAARVDGARSFTILTRVLLPISWPALTTLGGRVSLALDGGSLSSYPALVRIFGLLGAVAQPYRLPDLTRERMPYRRISADFDVVDGVMQTKNLLLDSEVVRVSGVGKVMLADQTVDLDLAVRPLQVLEQGIRRIPLLGRLLPQEQSLVIAYFDMQGRWADPAIAVAPVKSLSETVVDILLFLLKAPGRVISPNP